MVHGFPLKKLVVEARYKPDLGFYGKMDAVAIGLSEKFPNWERSPLTVEIRNRKKHRRIFLSHRRCFLDSDLSSGDPQSEVEFSVETVKSVCTGLGVSELTRVGVRQWFAADLEKTFAVMVDEIAPRFLSQNEEVSAILSDNIHDVAYVVDYETSEGWKYHVRLGPMTKQQWFQTVSYEANAFENPDEEDAATFDKYRSDFPQNFLYLDIDCFQENVALVDFSGLVTSFRRKSHDVVEKLIRYCKR